MRSVSLVALLVLGARLSFGQDPITMEQAINLAVKQNPRVKALLHEVAAAERGYAGARAWANPSITFTPGFTRAGSDEELLIVQPLELNGTRAARSGIAHAHLREVEAESLIELREIIYKTKTAYLELVRAQERKALARDLVKNAEALEQTAKRQVELGSRPGIEHTQVSIELTRTRQQATLADAEYAATLAEFNAEIGRPLETTVELPPIQFSSQPVNEEELLRKAVEDRGEVTLISASKQSFLQEAKLARAEGIPDLTPHFRAGSLTRTPRESGFGIGISIPLLDYGSRKNRVRQAEESARAQDFRLTATRTLVQQEVRQAVARLRAADAVLRSFQDGMLTDARKLVEATRNGFELGAITLAGVLEAQRTFRSVQTEYIDALVSHELARAQLERAAGSIPASLLQELRTSERKTP